MFRAPRGAPASKVGLLGGGILFSREMPPKIPPFFGGVLLIPTYFEKMGTLENVGNFSTGFGNVGNFFS